MKKATLSLTACVLMVVVLTGCPGKTTNIQGTWEWVEPAVPAQPSQSEVFASDEVNENFQNNERLRKTLILGPISNGIGSFSYSEESYLPDRQALRYEYDKYVGGSPIGEDLGAGVAWKWREIYKATGSYSTAPYSAEDAILYNVPECDTEVNADITSWAELHWKIKTDAEGKPVADSEGRALRNYYTVTDNSDTTNPLNLRALMGINPFDELLVNWSAGYYKFEYNSSLFSQEIYIRMN